MEEEFSVFTYARDAFKSAYNVNLKDAGRPFFSRMEIEYGTGEVLDAIDIAVEQYADAVTAVHMIEGILRNRKSIKTTMFGEE